MDKVVVYNVGLYCRLSLDDGNVGESGSIQTQKIILTKYCKDNNLNIYKIYVDDGYSGLNFNRPAFNEMLGDIESGKINMVITKDLSRLGRDYIQTGYYTEIYFPDHKVRYVAVSDGIDTINQNNDIAPFKNLLNEEGVITPSRYKFLKGDTRFARFNNTVWRTKTVNAILTDIVYIGHMENHKYQVDKSILG